MAFLGVVLYMPEALHQAPFLKQQHFFFKEHRETFAAMSKLIGEGRQCDHITLAPLLPDIKDAAISAC
jgi:replicative DNA helicase